MILNGKTQLGLAFDKYMQDELFNIHYEKYIANEPDLRVKMGATRQIQDLFRNEQNQNYVFRQTALDMASKIKLDHGKLEDLSFITEKLPVKKCTYLMGNNKFFRWFKWDNDSDIIVVCVKMVPPEKINSQEEVDSVDKILALPPAEIEKLVKKKKAEGKLTDYDYNFILNALKNKDYKNQAKKGLFYYLWGIKSGKLHFPVTERNEDFHNEMMEFVKLLIFTELTELETVELGPSQSVGTRKQGKWLNQTNKNVKIVDSSWNKILIKGQKFSVTGHIRLQPCGPGLKFRKPIYIDDFEKTGYTRNALKEA